MLKAQFQELVLGDGGLTSFVKLLVDSGTAILKFANSDIGQLIIKGTLLFTTISLLSKGFNIVSISVKSSIAEFIAYQTALVAGSASNTAMYSSTQLLIGGISALTKAWATSPFGMATIAVGSIMAIAAAYDALTVSQEEAIDSMNKYSSEYESLSSEIESIKTELDKTGKKIEEINSLDDLSITNEQELRNLQLQNAELDRELKLKEAIAEQDRKDAEESAKKALSTPTITGANAYGDYGEKFTMETPTEEMERYTKSLEANRTAQERVKEAFDNGKISAEDYDSQIKALKDSESELIREGNEQASVLLDISKNLTSTDEETQNLQASVNDFVDNWNDLQEAEKEAESSTEGVNNSLEDSEDILQDYADQLGTTVDELLDSADAAGMSAEEFAQLEIIDDINDKFKDSISEIESLDSVYNTLTGAVDEYNSSGGFSLDTISNLLSLGDEYISLLQFENGQLSLNQQGMIDLANARISEAEALALEEAQAKLAALANGTLSEQEANAGEQAIYAGKSASEAGALALQSGQDALSGAAGWNAFYSALAGGQGVGMDQTSNPLYSQIESELKNTLTSLESVRQNLTTKISSGAVKSAKKSGGSAGKAAGDAYKDAYEKELDSLDHDLTMNVISQKEYYDKLQELNEKYFGEASGQHEKYLDEYQKNEEKIFKGLQDLYKDTADYLEDQFDKKIDSIEEQKDAELDAIDEEIDAVKEAKDKRLDAINEQIEAVEEERDTILDSLNDQKDALEDLEDQELEAIDKQIEALETQRDQTESYWEERINSIQEANDAIDKQIKLEQLQQALEAAKYQKVKLFKDGRFQYVQDESKVEEAEQNLADYQEQLRREQEIADLEAQRDQELAILDEKIQNQENYRDQVQENYDNQIEDLENYIEELEEKYDQQLEDLQDFYDQVQEKYEERIERLEEHRDELEEQYDAQIKLYENQKEKFTEYVNATAEEQKRQLANELTGLQTENQMWMTRLENLAEFISEYNRLLAEKGEEGESVSSNYQGKDSIGMDINSYAKGTPSVGDNELAVVGENPYKEIVIGSKLNNNGTLLKLKKGSGVVNSKSVNTLAHNLNELGRINPSNYNTNNWSSVKNDNKNIQYFNFDRIELPNVTDGNSFVEVLSNQYKNYIIQSINGKD